MTRRRFLRLTSAAAGASFVTDSKGGLGVAGPEFCRGILPRYQGRSNGSSGRAVLARWEYHQGGLGGIWEVWRKVKESSTWLGVELPHSFNGTDAVDPDTSYYQGPGWYRAEVRVQNP